MRVFEAQKQHNEEAKMFSMPLVPRKALGVNSQSLGLRQAERLRDTEASRGVNSETR